MVVSWHSITMAQLLDCPNILAGIAFHAGLDAINLKLVSKRLTTSIEVDIAYAIGKSEIDPRSSPYECVQKFRNDEDNVIGSCYMARVCPDHLVDRFMTFACNEHLSCVFDILVERGADITMHLNDAVIKKNFAVAEWLLGRGGVLDVERLSKQWDIEVIDFILKYLSVDGKMLQLAVSTGNVAVVEHLIKNGAQPSAEVLCCMTEEVDDATCVNMLGTFVRNDVDIWTDNNVILHIISLCHRQSLRYILQYEAAEHFLYDRVVIAAACRATHNDTCMVSTLLDAGADEEYVMCCAIIDVQDVCLVKSMISVFRGYSATYALQVAASIESIPMIDAAICEGAQASMLLGHAFGSRSMTLFRHALLRGACPNMAADAAYTRDIPEFFAEALANGANTAFLLKRMLHDHADISVPREFYYGAIRNHGVDANSILLECCMYDDAETARALLSDHGATVTWEATREAIAHNNTSVLVVLKEFDNKRQKL